MLVAAGLVLRVVTVALYFPTVLQWIDVVRFSRLGPCRGLVSDFHTPAGDAVFPKITHAI